jgi:hypothetical protein
MFMFDYRPTPVREGMELTSIKSVKAPVTCTQLH